MVDTTAALTEERIWDLLNDIADPDIPVISIVELGLVRKVVISEQTKVNVTITPSYSGCPAMTLFKEEIKQVLLASGATAVEISISHSPAWSTDWLSEPTREKMRKHGIAPPEGNSTDAVALFSNGKKPIACPHCKSTTTKLSSQFGSTPCKALWYCNSCQQPFEYFKCY